MARLEKETQKAVLEYLTLKRIFHWRNNSGMMFSEYKGKKRAIKLGTTGSPDIFVLKNGTLIGIECKSDTGKQNDDQKAFQKEMEKNGGKYFLVRSLDDVVPIV